MHSSSSHLTSLVEHKLWLHHPTPLQRFHLSAVSHTDPDRWSVHCFFCLYGGPWGDYCCLFCRTWFICRQYSTVIGYCISVTHMCDNLSHICIAEIRDRRAAIENCVLAIQDWCASRRLQFNPDKTEIMWFGSRSNLTKLNSYIRMTCISDLDESSSTRLRQYGILVCYWTHTHIHTHSHTRTHICTYTYTNRPTLTRT